MQEWAQVVAMARQIPGAVAERRTEIGRTPRGAYFRREMYWVGLEEDVDAGEAVGTFSHAVTVLTEIANGF